MALRAFALNPALGGFGSESTAVVVVDSSKWKSQCSGGGDAWAQIIKELVDNAVDACKSSSDAVAYSDKKRVRVQIERYNDNDSDSDDSDLLRVTVIDNGCGIKDIQQAVEPFSTTKTGLTQDKTASKVSAEKGGTNLNKKDGKTSKKANKQDQTAGRFGIGLTLAILHAQRLLPDSCTSIQSATSAQSAWQSMVCVAEADNNVIKCYTQLSKAKTTNSESGTAVSILIPGGVMARQAWPRLAEYFARFHLCNNLSCSLEVSALPLLDTNRSLLVHNIAGSSATAPDIVIDDWKDGFDEEVCNTESSKTASASRKAEHNDLACRRSVQGCISRYLRCSMPIENIAHAGVTFKSTPENNKNRSTESRIEVSLVVVGSKSCDALANDNAAALSVIRFINDTPILDSAEASSCGVLQHLIAKRKVWNKYGLELSTTVRLNDATSLPLLDIDDCANVASSFSYGTHRMFQNTTTAQQILMPSVSAEQNNYHVLSSQVSATIVGKKNSIGSHKHDAGRDKGKQRKRQKKQYESMPFLPVKERLGNILVVVKVHADIHVLPLPTLAKDRFSTQDKSLLKAFDTCLARCLKSLQKSLPGKFLTPREVRHVEWNKCYLPSIVASISSVTRRSNSLQRTVSMMRMNSGTRNNTTDGFDFDGFDTVIEAKLSKLLAATDKQKVAETTEKKKKKHKVQKTTRYVISEKASQDSGFVLAATTDDEYTESVDVLDHYNAAVLSPNSRKSTLQLRSVTPDPLCDPHMDEHDRNAADDYNELL